MRRFIEYSLAVFLFVFAFSCAVASAQSPDHLATQPPNAPTPDPRPPTPFSLKNGLRLLVQPEPEAEAVTTYVFFNVGQGDEGKIPGMNALIARMWGRDTAYRSERRILQDLAGVGGVAAEFGADYVALRGVCGSDPSDVRKMLQTLLTNLVATPTFTPEIVAAARAEQVNAAALERDNLTRDVLATLRGRVWGVAPYGQPPFGDTERLAPFTADAAEKYYARLFRPERCLVAIVGNVNPETMAQLVPASLSVSDWFTGLTPPPSPKIIVEEIPAGLPARFLPRRAPATVTALGFLAPGTLNGRADNADEYAALLVLDAALGGGKSSRLFAALREGDAPLGYDVRTILDSNRARSLWAVYVVGDGHPPAVSDALKRELAALADNSRPLTADEIARARAFVTTRHAKERQRQPDRAFALGWSELIGLGADFETNFDARLAAVTPDAVNRLAQKIFRAPSAAAYSGRP